MTVLRHAAAGLVLGLLLAGPSPTHAQEAGPPATAVEVAEVTAGPLSQEVSAVGSLRSNESVVIRPEIAGRISEINFEEGSAVPEGTPLVTLDDSIYRAELQEAQATLNLAQRNYNRAKELFEKAAGTARSRDEAVSALETAQAGVEVAKARLDKMRIAAPFAGILGLRKVGVGDYVTPGQDLVNLEDIDPIKVDFRIPERYLSDLRVGQRIRVAVDAFPDQSFEGEVYAIDPRIDAEGRSIVIRARIANEGQWLRPGLFARVKLVVAHNDRALTIPEQAVVPQADGRYVFKVVEGKALLTKVMLGIRRDGRVEVTEGLAAGDTVVTAGQIKLRDGAAVTPVGGEGA